MGRPRKTVEQKRLQNTLRQEREDARLKLVKKKTPLPEDTRDERNYLAILDGYIDNVISGKVVAGQLIKLAVQRFISDLSRQGDDNFPFSFNYDKAIEHLKFAEKCRHWKGTKAREPITLEPHQVFQWFNVYGWRHNETNVRRFHRVIKLVARKNYKTTEAAIMALDHMMIDPPAGPQVFAGSMKHDQSIIVVNDAGMIAQMTPDLDPLFDLFKYRGMVQRVVNQEVFGFIAPLSKEGPTSSQDGLDPSFGIIDEYHAHIDDRVVNILESGFGNRPDWLELIISTAGANKYGPCYSVSRKTGINVLRGIQTDERLFLMFHELDEEDDWQDEAVWYKANPRMYADSDFIEYLRTRFIVAKNQKGEKESDFKTKNLNLWVDQYNAWFSDELWMNQTPGRSIEELEGKECYGGLDLAATRDFNALALLFPRDDGFFDVLVYFWLPAEMLDNRIERMPDFRNWIRNGNIKQTSGSTVDYQVILNDIRVLSHKYRIKSIAYDRKFAAPIVTSLESEIKLTPFDQGIANISYPTKKLDVLVGHRKINHYGNPVLRWMISNVAIYRDANDNIKVVKHKSTDAVDGVVAVIMAIGEYETFNMQGESIYTKRGVISI